MKTILSISFFLIISLGTIKGQMITKRPLHIQIDGGLNTYYGDIKRYRYVPTTRDNNELTPSGAIKASIILSKSLILSAQYEFGQISGTEKRQDLYFKANTQIISASGQLILNRIFDKRQYSFFNNRFVTYGSFGLGTIIYDTRKYILSTHTLIDSDGYSSVYSKNNTKARSLVIPVGLGIQFKLTDNSNIYRSELIDRLYLSLDAKMYFIDTDNFDLTDTDQSNKDKFLRISTGVIYVF